MNKEEFKNMIFIKSYLYDNKNIVYDNTNENLLLLLKEKFEMSKYVIDKIIEIIYIIRNKNYITNNINIRELLYLLDIDYIKDIDFMDKAN